MDTVYIVIMCLVCFILGTITAAYFFRVVRNVGTLRIDHTDPTEQAYFYLEVTEISKIKHGKTITMKVNEEKNTSQE